MANIPKAILDLAPFGIGTAAMTAALLGDGSEAEAAPPKAILDVISALTSSPDFRRGRMSIVAPVGVAGKIPAKLLAMAADAPATIGISAALEKLFGK